VSLPGRFVDTSAGRVYVHRAGRGQPLVLLHGYMMSHWYFHALSSKLGESMDVIAIDLPGYGESDRPSPRDFAYDYPAFAQVVAEVLDRIGLHRVRLLGHSMGGGVALTFAARMAERVERLVLECPAIYPMPLPVEARLLLNKTVGRFLFHNGMSRRELKRQMRKQHFKDASLVTDELVDYVWSRVSRAGGKDAAYQTLHTFASLSGSTADPMRVRAQTLLVWGDEDRMVPLSHGKRLAKAIPGAQLSVVPACGHNVHLERRDEFLRQVFPFLSDEKARSIEPTPVTHEMEEVSP
jgi:pimeloyl-ACP methyl ester carboxylesterase